MSRRAASSGSGTEAVAAAAIGFIPLFDILLIDFLAEKLVRCVVFKALCCGHEAVTLAFQILDNMRNLCN